MWMVLGFKYSLGVFRAFYDLHRKMTNRSVCITAGSIQTSETVCIHDVSTNSVLVLLHVAIVQLGRRNIS